MLAKFFSSFFSLFITHSWNVVLNFNWINLIQNVTKEREGFKLKSAVELNCEVAFRIIPSLLFKLESFFVCQVQHAYKGRVHRYIFLVQDLSLIHRWHHVAHLYRCVAVELGCYLLLHVIPQLVLQAFYVDLLPDSERVQLDLLIQTTRCIKSFRLLGLKHILQILYFFRVK
jgi:hypothetical protein